MSDCTSTIDDVLLQHVGLPHPVWRNGESGLLGYLVWLSLTPTVIQGFQKMRYWATPNCDTFGPLWPTLCYSGLLWATLGYSGLLQLVYGLCYKYNAWLYCYGLPYEKSDLGSVSCRGRTLSDLPKIGDSKYLWCLDRGSNATEVKAPKILRVDYRG